MSSTNVKSDCVELSVSNIGGIDETEVSFEPGITVLSGRNATNRTSLLQAIMAGLGSDLVSLKADADEGEVKLKIGSTTYTREFVREGDSVVSSGDPYLDNPELADLFAFLLESNEARRAVVQSGDLHELLLRPVDTDKINSEIESLTRMKQQITDQIEEIEEEERKLTKLSTELDGLEDQINSKEQTVEELEEELESVDVGVEETKEQKRKREQKFEQLRRSRSELQEVHSRIDGKQDALESLRKQRDELEAEEAEIPEAPTEQIQNIESQIGQLRSEIQGINGTVNEIQTLIQFNEDKLEEQNNEITEALGLDTSASDTTTDRLVEDRQTICWTCGSEVETSAIEETLQQLRELNSKKLDRKRELQDEIEELEIQKHTYEEKQRQREQVARELEATKERIDEQESMLQELRERESDLESDVEDLEEVVSDLEMEDSDVLKLHKQISELEGELTRLKSERNDLQSEIDESNERINRREELEDEREDIQERLVDLRTKIDRLEQQAADEFNDHMESVLSILSFENIERIWIERIERERKKGRREVTETVFELHVIRSSNNQGVYEDRIENLSESERETTGLIFALAGYLVHEVYEHVPFMLLDSLEAIDADRISQLLEYFSEYADYLVVALLTEDAAAVAPEHQQITRV